MFQQELLELFDNFRIKNTSDYHRLAPGEKPYFIRRLYRVFVTNTDTTLKDISQSGGVKFHFGASGYLDDRNPNVPNETFLKKLSFFSNRTLITFPFQKINDKKLLHKLKDKPKKAWRRGEAVPMLFGDITTDRDGYGGFAYATSITYPTYTIDPVAFDDLLTVTCNLRPAIKEGAAYLLPAFPDTSKEFRSKKLGLTSANFQLKDLQVQFDELNSSNMYGVREKSGLTQLLLPHFANVPFERIIEIRSKESELYWEFQRRLENLLIGASQVESERILLSFMREVDEGVREMRRKFVEIQQAYHRKNIYMLIKFLSAAMVLLAPVDAREAIGAILGSTTIFDYLTMREDKAKELYETRNNKFYLPWLIFKAGEK